jgi:hypothetical protein
MISSLVTADPVSPPPVLTTVTNCRPSALDDALGWKMLLVFDTNGCRSVSEE